MMKWPRRILITLVIIYVGITAIAFLAQRSFLYFPTEFYELPPAGFVEVKTDEGILGWHSAAKDGRPTVMVFHGNASSIDSNMHIFRDFRAAGYGIWSVGYPGYPGNEGSPTQTKIVNAAAAQYETLRQQGVTDIIFYGTSLGSGVAAQLSAKYEPDLLILDAPFNSVLDIAKKQAPILPTTLLLKDKWQSDIALKDVNAPLIWIHGTADRVIPIAQGQKLYDGYGGPKTALIISDANHINTWVNGGREAVLTALNKL